MNGDVDHADAVDGADGARLRGRRSHRRGRRTGPGADEHQDEDGRCRGKRRRWPCRCWRRGVRRGHEGSDRRRAVDRTMKQAIAEGKPWSRPGADEGQDEDGDEGEEDLEGP